MSVSTPVIVARGVAQRFGSVHALQSVDLRVDRGEVIAVLGPNGAGKTTLIDVILGLTRPTGGQVEVFGLAPRAAVRRSLVGAILQSGGLLPDITVRQTVQMIAATHPHPRKVDAVLEETRLSGIADRRISHCSGGEKQRVKFALALLANPELIIFDEPTTGMDPAARALFWDDIYLRAAAGKTILFTTHYLEEAQRFAQRIVFLRGGRIIADGATSDVLRAAQQPVVEFDLADAAELHHLPFGNRVRRDGRRFVVQAVDSDEVVRSLLQGSSAHNIRVTEPTLDEAFHALSAHEKQETEEAR